MHHMQIRTYKKFWYGIDGAIYLHEKHRKRIEWDKIKARIEGETEHTPEASPEVSLEKETDEGMHRAGKEPMEKKKKKKYKPMTGGKFHIRENLQVESSSDSEDSLPNFPEGPGEASSFPKENALAKLMADSLNSFKKDIKEFISSEIKTQMSSLHQTQPPPSRMSSGSARSFFRSSPVEQEPFQQPIPEPIPEAVTTDTSTATGSPRAQQPYEPTPPSLSLVPFTPLDVLQRPEAYLPTPSVSGLHPLPGKRRRQKAQAEKSTIPFTVLQKFTFMIHIKTFICYGL